MNNVFIFKNIRTIYKLDRLDKLKIIFFTKVADISSPNTAVLKFPRRLFVKLLLFFGFRGSFFLPLDGSIKFVLQRLSAKIPKTTTRPDILRGQHVHLKRCI